MAVLVFLVLFLAMTSHSSATYCICKDGVGDPALQKSIDYACGAGADCSSILQNGACYNPNTVKSHCDYAVNSYFQRKSQAAGTCDFAGTAVPSATAPVGQSTTCVYQATPGITTGNGTTPTPTSTTPSTTPPSTTSPTTTTPTTPTSTTPGSSIFGTGLGPTGSGLDNSSGAVKNLLQNTHLIMLLFPLALTSFWFSGFLLLWV